VDPHQRRLRRRAGRRRSLARAEGGALFEQAGVGYSEVSGATLPPSATAHRPELAGAPWRALGVSLVLHPRNPHVPTTHMNVRYFEARPAQGAPVWWFGGGWDLTPFYPDDADVRHWHEVARRVAVQHGGEARYARTRNGATSISSSSIAAKRVALAGCSSTT
jgi:coproporphyrinogen III oxidase